MLFGFDFLALFGGLIALFDFIAQFFGGFGGGAA